MTKTKIPAPSVRVDGDYIYLENVHIMYTTISRPAEVTSEDDDGNKSTKLKYLVTALVSEDVADEFSLLGLARPEPKKFIETGDSTFEKRFKIEKPEWSSGKKHYTIKFGSNADRVIDKSTGERELWPYEHIARPKMYVLTEAGREDVTNAFITNESVGTIILRKYQTGKFGTMCSISGIVLSHMVKQDYTPPVDPLAAFGDVVAGTTPQGNPQGVAQAHVEDENEKPKQKTQQKVKPKESDPEDFDDFDEDIPF